jgi:hypothetical protein
MDLFRNLIWSQKLFFLRGFLSLSLIDYLESPRSVDSKLQAVFKNRRKNLQFYQPKQISKEVQ